MRWSRAADASGPRAAWRWHRWRTGCATRRSSRRRRPSTRPGGPKSTGWSRPGAAGRGARAMADAWQRHRFFEGLARALLAVGRPMLLVLDNMHWCDQETLAFVTFCLGLAAEARIWWPARSQRRPRRAPLTRGLDRPDAGHRAADRAFPHPFEDAETARLAGQSPGSPLPRPTPTCCTRPREASRCTSSRRCAEPPTCAAPRCRPVI